MGMGSQVVTGFTFPSNTTLPTLGLRATQRALLASSQQQQPAVVLSGEVSMVRGGDCGSGGLNADSLAAFAGIGSELLLLDEEEEAKLLGNLPTRWGLGRGSVA